VSGIRLLLRSCHSVDKTSYRLHTDLPNGGVGMLSRFVGSEEMRLAVAGSSG
jgi:hypothetical protein